MLSAPAGWGCLELYEIAYVWPLTGLPSWAFSRRVLLIPFGVTNAALLLSFFCLVPSLFLFLFSRLSSPVSLLSSILTPYDIYSPLSTSTHPYPYFLTHPHYLYPPSPTLTWPHPLFPPSSTLTHPHPPLFTLTYLHLPSPQLATLICHTCLPSFPPSSDMYLNLAIFSDLVPQHGLGLCRSAGAQPFGVANQDHLLTLFLVFFLVLSFSIYFSSTSFSFFFSCLPCTDPAATELAASDLTLP